MEYIIDRFPAWTVREVKKLSYRERKHWYKRAVALTERDAKSVSK